MKKLVLISILVAAMGAWAQMGPREPAPRMLPPNLGGVTIEQKLGAQMPLDAQFKDENGNTVTLAQFFHHNKPVVLNLVYFECPMLCTEALNGLTSTMRAMKLDAGSDYDVLTISFDPRETPELARAKKAAYLQRYNRPGGASGWHFLTGDEKNIKAVTNTVGFYYKWDDRSQQWAHATALMVLTADGKVAQYFYGVEYSPRDVRLALVQSSQGKVGTLVDQVLLYCYHYDPRSGRYGVIISRVIRLGGLATILILGSFMLMMFRLEKRRFGPKPGSDPDNQSSKKSSGRAA